MDSGHKVRIEAGVSFDWQALPPLAESLAGLDRTLERLHFRRGDSPATGLADFIHLKTLWVRKANQRLIDEIGRLPQLETLYIEGLSASSLEPLGHIRTLRRLVVHGGSKIENLNWLRGLPSALSILYLEGFSRISDLGPVSSLEKLTAFGFEGGMSSHARIDTLAPLASLNHLRYLFLAATRVAKQSLEPLRALPNLEHLESISQFPEQEFIALQKARPTLHCDWIRMIESHGSLRSGNRAILDRIRQGG